MLRILIGDESPVKAVVAGLCAVAMLTACDTSRRSPLVNPFSPAPAPPSPPLPTKRSLSGVVSADGAPVAGATVSVLDSSGAKATQTAVTGADGSYAFTEFDRSCPPACLMVSASKAGFFANVQWPHEMVRIDFPLDPLAYISVGDVVRGQTGEAMCAGLGYGTVDCQRFAVKAPASGVLQVTISATRFDFDIDAVNPDGTFATYISGGRSPLMFELHVEADRTYEIRVARVGPNHDFELTTAMK